MIIEHYIIVIKLIYSLKQSVFIYNSSISSHVKKYCFSANTNIACVSPRNRHTNMNLQNPASNLFLINEYISPTMKYKLTTPETPRNTHFNQVIGTTFNPVVIMKIVNEYPYIENIHMY